MIQEDFHDNAMEVFIRYGFRKTSMDDVASAVGLSRQAIYKRFGNKETLFKAIVDECVNKSFREARAALDDDTLSIRDRLIESCNASTGQYVDSLRSSPHSYEVIAMAKVESTEQYESLNKEFEDYGANLLLRENVFSEEQKARDALFVIEAASKGLLHTAQNQEEYQNGMRTVICTVIPAEAPSAN